MLSGVYAAEHVRAGPGGVGDHEGVGQALGGDRGEDSGRRGRDPVQDLGHGVGGGAGTGDVEHLKVQAELEREVGSRVTLSVAITGWSKG